MAVRRGGSGGRGESGGGEDSGGAESDGELAEHGGISCFKGCASHILNMGRRPAGKGSRPVHEYSGRYAFLGKKADKTAIWPAFTCRAAGKRRKLTHRDTVSYTHLRAHETDSYLVCRLLLEKKK